MKVSLKKAKFKQPEQVFASAVFFAQSLKLPKRTSVEIVCKVLNGDAGVCIKKSSRRFVIEICPSIQKNYLDLIDTVAHEFVHVHQWSRDRIRTKQIGGKKYESLDGGKWVWLDRYPNTPVEEEARDVAKALTTLFLAQV